ncbi:MAG TPA: isoleucine--tRNA ligase [Chitinophagales bacterium]|nr:isoleucine--tRNA ligase [Chitinophagales bacterium]
MRKIFKKGNCSKMAFKEIKHITQSDIEKQILDFWQTDNTFHNSITTREGNPDFVFYEGPPSANGMPGIHHVLSRSLKDIFCRYKTLKGYKVNRKGGWDTHGLPVELQVEKKLNITKKDIGTKISVAEYNKECREEVMKFKNVWDDLTQKMGYWVDLEHPYITFENAYIESLWWLLQQLYDKGLLYKGLKIQPYSPAAGTGLSSHELNLPGCYREVKDTTCVAQFKFIPQSLVQSPQLKAVIEQNNIADTLYFLAWTTTPWTLPSNTALCVGPNIDYVLLETFNPYTNIQEQLILAKDLVGNYFQIDNENKAFSEYKNDGKNLPYRILSECKGNDLVGIRYEQLLPFESNSKAHIDGDAFRVISGDFVTTSDGTGIVHIAPSFGADDMKVAAENGIGSLTLVDKEGKFIDGTGEFSGRYVKDYKNEPNYVSVDIDICVKLKKENKAFKVEKYEHSYPHCWRTDKPIIYYPLDSWFIRVTAVKDRMIELNKTINWKPESTGTGRFGQWLENLVDWNLSRSRYWGTPLPIWRTEDGTEEICIGSIEQLQGEISKSLEAGFLKENPFKNGLDLHKPYVDDVILVSPSGKPMHRETDLIDVWFDSGAMPYAQFHYPFENKDIIDEKKGFPADYIAEGVDQTRGWFYTLHAIAVMLFDSVAYKNVISNGLVLDKNGNKMSKRWGNAVDPFETIGKYGADVTRWYMIANSQPWDNLKFDTEGIEETGRKLFNTLSNTYSFFALYANIDGFENATAQIPVENRPEIDRWILSLLNTLVKNTEQNLDDYEPTRAAREIQEFVNDHLSNWYVRLSRRRFWKTDVETDKIAAYQTLYECLLKLTQLMSPIAPFYADFMYQNLTCKSESVHLSLFPTVNEHLIDKQLEERMELAQNISSMVLSLRKKENIKVRQPLQKILIPAIDKNQIEQIDRVKELILSEVNVKEIAYISDTSGIVSKKVKPNFKLLGKKLGAKMKAVSEIIQQFDNQQIAELEKNGSVSIQFEIENFPILLEEVEIVSDDIQGWLVASNNGMTVALDSTITESLKNEGFAREIVNKIQNERKEADFQVTDKIVLYVQNHLVLNEVLKSYKEYICNETLAQDIVFTDIEERAKDFDINGELLKLFILKL